MKKFQNHNVLKRSAIRFLFDTQIEYEHQNMFLHQSRNRFLKIKNKTFFIEHKHIQIGIMIEFDE